MAGELQRDNEEVLTEVGSREKKGVGPCTKLGWLCRSLQAALPEDAG